MGNTSTLTLLAHAGFSLDALLPLPPHARAAVLCCAALRCAADDRNMPKRTTLRDVLCYEEILEAEVG